jgi:two-component system sensor histidine kinase EvgS
MFPQYVAFFEEDAQLALRELLEAEAKGDRHQLARISHRLRGGAANFGAHTLMRICRELEGQCAEEETGDFGELIELLREELARVQEGLEAELQRGG